MTTAVPSSPTVRLRSVAIPPEHGAWGFLLEPIALGLAVAPSLAGVCLAVGVLGAFLARYPLKIAAIDWQRRRRTARAVLAWRVALAYSALGALGLAGAVMLAGIGVLLPLLLAVPLTVVLFLSYAQNRARDLLPELAGASALAGTASGVALAAGEPLGIALALWAILLARDVPSILYVRARLRLERGRPAARGVALTAGVLGTGVTLALALAGVAPAMAVLAMLILLSRAAWGLSTYRRAVRVQTIGLLEMGYGLLAVVLVAAGYALDL